MAQPTAYQAVVSASDYDASAGPTYLKFDGVDDSLASATFAAGTIPGLTDCLIAVRRTDTSTSICGLYKAPGDVFFGAVTSGDADPCFSGTGSPTVYVDGVQLTGGTSVTRGTLFTALTSGIWHIMEFRGLNLSAWTQAQFGGYAGGFNFPGSLGDIQLFASGQDANRDLSRAQMAAYFGVTLP